MRIWSLHPSLLDAKGLVALWRETLLAKHVLENKTKGYKHHPQLIRFKSARNPLASVNAYLQEVLKEANIRAYNFDQSKIDLGAKSEKLKVTDGQMAYELKHLKGKLQVRDKKKLLEVTKLKAVLPHPLFKVVKGEIEDWETPKSPRGT